MMPPTASEVVDAIEEVRDAYTVLVARWSELGELVRIVDPASWRRADAYIGWDDAFRDVGAGHNLTTWLRELEQSAVDAEDAG